MLAFKGGRKESVLCSLLSLCSRPINSSQCLSLPITISPSSTACKTDVLEVAFGFKCLFKHKRYFFFRHESTDKCWILYRGNSLGSCDIMSVQALVLPVSSHIQQKSTCSRQRQRDGSLSQSQELVGVAGTVT